MYIVVIVLHYIQILNHYIVHLKLPSITPHFYFIFKRLRWGAEPEECLKNWKGEVGKRAGGAQEKARERMHRVIETTLSMGESRAGPESGEGAEERMAGAAQGACSGGLPRA